MIAVDMDGTLCEWEARTWEEIKNAKPKQDVIDIVNWLYLKWAHIVIYTAREQMFYTLTQNRLEEHWVRFHWINMKRKPWCDLMIDDKCINVKDLLLNNLSWSSDVKNTNLRQSVNHAPSTTTQSLDETMS